MIATVLAIVFIIYGLNVMSRSRNLQVRIAKEVKLLDELNMLSDDIRKLGLSHRTDLSTGQNRWHAEVLRFNKRVDQIALNAATTPGIQELPLGLNKVIHQADSLHRESVLLDHTSEARHNAEAIFQLMIQRAQQVVDRSARQVHEQGLGSYTASMSDRWSEAQVLLVTACLLALALAWLAGVSNRLLIQSRLRSDQLEVARLNLEKANRDLRETMLSKEEKEVMIKEIHHRVKNNLQIVKSLIRFQMDQVKDEHTLELFNECVNRVSAMALVHEQTYLSKDLANIDVNTYLGHLTRDLCHAYTVNTRLELDMRIEVESLGVDTLIPLGLLINEVISNSLKHAFKGRKQGTIIMHLFGSAEHGLHLRIGDDGVGLPDRSRWENPQSLGMDLIHTLAGQLDATVSLAPGTGTVYELSSIQQEQRKRA
ncbi:MAG: sensor histidine kinase [Flavobacteriales bacterium]|nr:sensor histidine kinase [Flavobacteriales bacterium]